MAKLTKKALKNWIDYLDGRGLVVTDDELIDKEIDLLREDNETINSELLSSLQDCAEQLRLFLELHEDDEDAPAILEKANKVIAEANNVEKWKNNSIQFPRLIAEIESMGGFTNKLIQDLKESMDLNTEELNDLIDRAVILFDKIKSNI